MKPRQWITVAIAVGSLLASPAGAGQGPWPSDWRPAGQGEMRWFGLAIYQARLWAAPETRFTASQAPDRAARFALELTYARDIPGERLVDSSIDELTRLGWRDKAQLARWRQALAEVFPDVRAGERIVGLREPAQGALFYHQGRATGRIDDPDLAHAFFGIWLDPRTREPGLRASLLGQP